MALTPYPKYVMSDFGGGFLFFQQKRLGLVLAQLLVEMISSGRLCIYGESLRTIVMSSFFRL